MPLETQTAPPVTPSPEAKPGLAPAAPSPSPAAPAPASPPADNPFSSVDSRIKLPDKPVAPPADKGKAAPKESPKPPAPPQDKVRPVFKEPKELRAELDRVSGELKSRETAIAEMKAKIEAAEARGKDVSVLSERLERLQKQLEEKEGELRAARQETSADFKEKFEKPYLAAADYAKRTIEQLEVVDPQTDQRRPAKFEDFVMLYQMPLNKAIQAAGQMFPEAAQLVVNHLTELHRLDYQRGEALKAEKEQWKTRAAEEDARRVQQREQLTKTWEQVNKDLTGSIDDYRDPTDDKELAELRAEGYRIVDTMPATLEQRILKDAHVRQRAAAFGPMKMRLLRMTQENEALKAELQGLKNPQPGDTRGGGGGTAPKEESWEAGLAKVLSATP